MQKDLADAGQIDLLDDLDNVSLKLRTFTDRMKNASYGYSGFFDTIKINEKELAQIYAFDVAFFELGDQISHALDTVESSVGGDGLRPPFEMQLTLPARRGRITTIVTRP